MVPESDRQERSSRRNDDYRAYVAEISDGCGCVELWEYLSERRHEG